MYLLVLFGWLRFVERKPGSHWFRLHKATPEVDETARREEFIF